MPANEPAQVPIREITATKTFSEIISTPYTFSEAFSKIRERDPICQRVTKMST